MRFLALLITVVMVARPASPAAPHREHDHEVADYDRQRKPTEGDTVGHHDRSHREREEAAARWAPVVWLHPQELYFPGDVHAFLAHVNSSHGALDWVWDSRTERQYKLLPGGSASEHLHLVAPTGTECANCTERSFLHGQRPVDGVGPPVYVHIHSCADEPFARNKSRTNEVDSGQATFNQSASDGQVNLAGNPFTVTYWFFYPFNRGKEVCTSNVVLVGRMLFPRFGGKCLAEEIAIGNHVGDWEHISINFQNGSPKKLYISAHNFGAFYSYETASGRFEYKDKDARKGSSTASEYPRHLDLENGRLVVYSANGSHGTWPNPGRHWYQPTASLKDDTGRGVRWDTWKNLEVIDTVHQTDQVSGPLSRQWLEYRGRWGNPSKNCYAGLLGNCELGDGPTGIPRKRNNFPCSAASSPTPSHSFSSRVLMALMTAIVGKIY